MAITPAMMEEMLEKMFLKYRESMVQDIVKALSSTATSPVAAAPAAATPEPVPPTYVPPPAPPSPPATPKKSSKYNKDHIWQIQYKLGYRGDNRTPPSFYKDYFYLDGSFLGAYIEDYAINEDLETNEDGSEKLEHKLEDIIDYYPNWNEISSKWKKVFKEYNWTEENHNFLLETLMWADNQEIYSILV